MMHQLLCVLTLASVAGVACSSSKDEEGGGGPGLGVDGPIFGDGMTADPNARPGFGGEVCAGQTAGAEVAQSVVQLLVDTSGSMGDDAPGATRGSKWTVTRGAVLDAIDGMPADTSLGLIFYPDVPANTQPCFSERTAVNAAPLAAAGSPQREQLLEAFADQAPGGGTPTHDAYRYAVQQMESTRAIGSRFVVLITDGNPTYLLGCEGTGLVSDPVDPSPLVGEASRAQAQSVRTFVIGSPGSEGARESLSRMAEAGGTATPGCSHSGPNYCHFDMTRERDLAAGLAGALKTITGLALSCRYDIPEPPGGALLDPAKVNVLFTPRGGTQELVPQSPGGGCSDGWQYSEGQTQVQLCGSTCDRVRASSGALTLEFGCSTQVR
ncbi:MAG TPA: vWA domain-containing protein [Polyangiaceae bacterium]|nr:vWA domain-containing protein [Polyangiaceae bacterium]